MNTARAILTVAVMLSPGNIGQQRTESGVSMSFTIVPTAYVRVEEASDGTFMYAMGTSGMRDARSIRGRLTVPPTGANGVRLAHNTIVVGEPAAVAIYFDEAHRAADSEMRLAALEEYAE